MSTDLNLDALVDGVIDDHASRESDVAPISSGRTYVDAIAVSTIRADHTYQRPLDQTRVSRMANEYDQSLVGVLEVSLRVDGSFRVIDGQHRLAMVRQVRGMGSHVACNVHTGLTPEQEAQLFFDIDKKRRRLTGWDRWNARRGAGEQAVIDIESIATIHGLKIDPSPKPMHLRCVSACEKLVTLGGLEILDEALQVCVAAYAGDADSLRAEIVHGVGLVLAFYPADELDRARLIAGMQTLAARQISARAAALRETVSGQLPRLAGSVLIDRYNAEPGKKVEPFLKRVTAGKAHTPPQNRGRSRMNLTLGEIDTVAIERRVAGDRTVTLTESEQLQTVLTLAGQGRSDSAIADIVGISSRTVLRIRNAHHIPTTWSNP